MRMIFRLLGCLALIFLMNVPAEAGLFGRCGGGLFGGRLRQRSASCYSAQASGFQSYQSYQSFESYQGAVTPSLQSLPAYPTQQAPPAQYRACPSGQCPVSYSAPNTPAAPSSLQAYIQDLNALRQTYGLSPVWFDQGLYTDAVTNNAQQNSRGLGHHYMGRARRQNSGMGNWIAVFRMWQASPAHRAALLDPSIRRVAIASSGAFWTFSAS